MKKDIEDIAILWVTCEKEGMNEAQQKQMKLWLEESDEHKQAYNQIKSVQSVFSKLPNTYSRQLSSIAHKGARRVKLIEQAKPVLSYAAAIILTLAFMFNSYDYFIPNFNTTLKTQNEIVSDKTLPDGSQITMDAKTSMNIKYYANKREVILHEGQVLFKVAKDASKPFTIMSGSTSIEVVGTQFEVKKLDKTTTVSVEEGIVKIGHIANVNTKPQIITRLYKGEKVILKNDGKIEFLGDTPIGQIATWRNGEIIFSNTTLQESFEVFSKYNEFDFVLGKGVDNLTFSGKFDTNGIDKFLNAIQKIYPLHIKKHQNIISVSK